MRNLSAGFLSVTSLAHRSGYVPSRRRPPELGEGGAVPDGGPSDSAEPATEPLRPTGEAGPPAGAAAPSATSGTQDLPASRSCQRIPLPPISSFVTPVYVLTSAAMAA